MINGEPVPEAEAPCEKKHKSMWIQKVLKSWFGQLFLSVIFPEYLSFQQEEFCLSFFFLSFPLTFPKFHMIRFLKSKRVSVTESQDG